MTKLPQTVTLPYLGTRNYIQGGTLFKALKPYISKGREISFKVSKMILTNRVMLHPLTASAKSSHEYCCTCYWSDDFGKQGLGVTEIDAVPKFYEEYDEAGIVSLAKFEGKCATVDEPNHYPFIDLIVAINKKLLLNQALLSPDDKLLFTRLDIAELPKSNAPLLIDFERDMAMRHFVSGIYVLGNKLGNLYFSLRPK
jgi:hypothetical protein